MKIELTTDTTTDTETPTSSSEIYIDSGLVREVWDRRLKTSNSLPVLPKEKRKVTFTDSTYFIRPNKSILERRKKKIEDKNLVDKFPQNVHEIPILKIPKKESRIKKIVNRLSPKRKQ